MKALPEDFLRRMRALLGNEYAAFLASYEQPAARGIRLNLKKFAALHASSHQVRPEALVEAWGLVPLLHHTERDGICREYILDAERLLAEGIRPGRHPYHEAGLYYLQEPSAMQVVPGLSIQPWDRVADLCAAPGGKSTQAADLLDAAQGGWILANEFVPKRAQILSSNFERMGIANGAVCSEDTAVLAARFPEYFTKIIVDAPCSGEGMFRKDDTAVAEWSEENILRCAGRQKEILQNAVRMLAPGGRLSYSTCTFETCENEENTAWFLQQHPEFTLLCERRIWPHREAGEGHYLAVFEKRGAGVQDIGIRASLNTDGQCCGTAGVDGGLGQKMAGVEQRSAAGAIAVREASNQEAERSRQRNSAGMTDAADMPNPENARLRRWNSAGTQEKGRKQRKPAAGKGRSGAFASAREARGEEKLWEIPAAIPELGGLNILRCGLYRGRQLGDRFEPSHAASHAADLRAAAEDAVLDLALADPRVEQYLCGQQLAGPENLKGWVTVAVDGAALGCGKAVGGQIKNHYPKGLRWV